MIVAISGGPERHGCQGDEAVTGPTLKTVAVREEVVKISVGFMQAVPKKCRKEIVMGAAARTRGGRIKMFYREI